MVFDFESAIIFFMLGLFFPKIISELLYSISRITKRESEET